ncbi:hypothetical protein NC651_023386 [Populus alba x Populus x berolinensis]|nr:hypothetical protein NC651_023386 [Populus alba x Populus x berolinensis]
MKRNDIRICSFSLWIFFPPFETLNLSLIYRIDPIRTEICIPLPFSPFSSFRVKVKITGLHENYIVIISCVILVGLFSLQHHGTNRVAFLFAPIVTAWLLCISSIGIYNIFRWNRHVFCAISPIYMLKFLKNTGTEGWVSLGGVVLSITGVETMFADLGHFSSSSIKVAFTCVVYPCLILAYMESVFWPVFIVATFAAVVGSQAVISATFSMISQCCALNCFPRVKIVHTSSKIYGQIYIPEVNWMLMCLCLAVTIGLRDTKHDGPCIWCQKVGGFHLCCPLIFMVVMYIWNYGTMKKHQFDVEENKVSMNRIVSLGPSLGMVRVPGIGLVYSNLAIGVPAVFGHFVTNLPAFHQVLVFVCVKSVQVPHVSENERLLISRVGPKEYGMFRLHSFKGFVASEHPYTNSRRKEKMVQSSCDIQAEVAKTGSERLENTQLKHESLQILKAKESGVAYILGIPTRRQRNHPLSSRKIAINVVYTFLSKNSRELMLFLMCLTHLCWRLA